MVLTVTLKGSARRNASTYVELLHRMAAPPGDTFTGWPERVEMALSVHRERLTVVRYLDRLQDDVAKPGLRIASLLPSATEIVYALGLGDSLVAVTHECDFPTEAASKPVVTRNLLPADLSPEQVDRAVRESQRDAHSIYTLELDELANLSPDIVLTQSLCEVCAVPRSKVEEAVCSMPHQAQVVSLDPHTLNEVLQCLLRVGACLDVPD